MKHEDVFEQLEPPRGGLAKLRERMAPRPSWMARRLVPMTAALAVAAVVLFLSRRGKAPDLVAAAHHHGGVEEVSLGLAPSPGGPLVPTAGGRATTALAEVPTSNPTVAFYWVSSTAWAD
jgi:hypothetical protein